MIELFLNQSSPLQRYAQRTLHAWDAYANGGEFGIMDGLGIAGAALSIGSLKKVMNKCFTSDMQFVIEVNDTSLNGLTVKQGEGSSEESSFGWLIIGVGIAGFGMIEIRRYLRAMKEEAERKKHELLDNVFADRELLNKLLRPVRS